MPKLLPSNATIVAAEKGVTAANKYNNFFVSSFINQYTARGRTNAPIKVSMFTLKKHHQLILKAQKLSNSNSITQA